MAFHFSHVYEAKGAKPVMARARNKCQGCQKAIPKGSTYLLVFLFDTCSHYIGGHYIGLHKRLKLCRACREIALHPKALITDGRVVAEDNYPKRIRAAMKEMGVSRYEMALKGKS